MTVASTFLKNLPVHVLSPLSGWLPAHWHAYLPAYEFEALRSFAERFAHAAAPIAVTALWQGAVVAAGLALCLRIAPRVAAAHRFAAWAAGFGVLVALPFAPLVARLIGGGAGPEIGTTQLPFPVGHGLAAHPLLAISDRWSLAIAALWVVVALVRAVDLAIDTTRLRRLWKSAVPAPANLLKSEMRTNCRFEICTTRELDRPSVIGFFAPRILIPEWLMERLTAGELEQVVLHECEHLRRRDDWTNLLQKICLVVFPLNAALMFIERRLCREREMACDEGVVRRTRAPRAYAACLAGLAERQMEHRAEALTLGARARALTLGAFERRPELARRVHSVLFGRRAIDPMVSRALVGAVGCALVVGAVVLARCPQLVAFVPAEPRVTVDTAQTELRSDERAAPMSRTARNFRAMNAMMIMPDTTGRGGAHYTLSEHKIGSAEYKAGPTGSAGPRAWETMLRQRAVSAQTGAAGADAVVDGANSEAATPHELIVLTAFEQVQSASGVLGDRVISDYVVDGNGRLAPGGAGQVTVTRLVFRVFSRATAGASESDGPTGVTGRNETDAQATGEQPVTSIPASAIETGALAQQMNAATEKPEGQATNKSSNPAAAKSLPRNANSLTGQLHAVALGNGWFVIQL